MFHLWNWKLCQRGCFIPSKVRQSSTFCISIHPKTFIKLAFVREVNLSSPVPFPFSPAAFVPVSICLHMRHIRNFNPLSTLNYNRFQNQISGIFLTIANNSMSMTLILHPLSLINVSILIVHLSPTSTTVLNPDPLING